MRSTVTSSIRDPCGPSAAGCRRPTRSGDGGWPSSSASATRSPSFPATTAPAYVSCCVCRSSGDDPHHQGAGVVVGARGVQPGGQPGDRLLADIGRGRGEDPANPGKQRLGGCPPLDQPVGVEQQQVVGFQPG